MQSHVIRDRRVAPPAVPREDAPPTVVAFEHVTKAFTESVKGLDDVTLDVRRGEITVLLGLSGSGKSTFLRHVNGLHLPTSGQITCLGKRIDTASERELRRVRRRIGFIFQSFDLVGEMSVWENVCAGQLGSLRGPRLTLLTYPKSVRRDALEQLERVGLADRAYQRADTLSGGQQQRVAIARALIQRPEILLADEPVASLDTVSSQQVIDLLSRISREENLTILCSLHQVELAMGFADRLVGLRAGRVVLDQRTKEIAESDVLRIYSQVSAVPDHPGELELAAAR